MGKSYVENSLKRFLKRKVKITMGVVVTFLITGAVSLGADDYPLMDKIGNSGYINAMESLNGLGSDKADISMSEKTYSSSDGKTNTLKIEKAAADYVLTIGSTPVTNEIKIEKNEEDVPNSFFEKFEGVS